MIKSLIKMLKDYFRQEGIFLEVIYDREKSNRMNGIYYTITHRDEYVVSFNLDKMINDCCNMSSPDNFDQMYDEIFETLIDTVEGRLEPVGCYEL